MKTILQIEVNTDGSFCGSSCEFLQEYNNECKMYECRICEEETNEDRRSVQ